MRDRTTLLLILLNVVLAGAASTFIALLLWS
jgi:hypothetical protein